MNINFNLSLLKGIKIFSLWMLILCGTLSITFAQNGEKVEYKLTLIDQDSIPVIGADIYTPHSSSITTTDENGVAEMLLEKKSQQLKIVIQQVTETTIEVNPAVTADEVISIMVTENHGEIIIVGRRKGTTINRLDPIKTENLNTKELLKAACCNLSESFETTPSIDAGFTDAVSGYKQISMLGLSGPNVSLTRENLPDIRGLASITGFTFIPGPWVESIQISKGTGSVVNGFEGVAGQINVELHKVREEEGIKFLANAYQSVQGRTEGNIVWNKEINHDLSTSVFAHAKSNWLKVDQNKDGFVDQPLGETYLLGNRWMYTTHKGWELQLGVKAVLMNLWGGHEDYTKGQNISESLPWGFENNIKRGEFWAKIGKVNPQKPYQSMGLQLSGSMYKIESNYGLRSYDAQQNSFYLNYIYQSIISNTNHVIKAGASLALDNYDEKLLNSKMYVAGFNRKEVVPGVFTEYSYKLDETFNLVAGLRADYNNIYGAFITPRLHLRYAPVDKSVIRASIGRAQRTANVMAEQVGFLSSNRQFVFPVSDGDKTYGLDPEIAWNMGVNFTQNFILNYKDGSFGIDYYFTHFENMVVADFEQYEFIKFYNVKNGSKAHSIQAQVDYELFRNFDLRMAYRYYDVKIDYADNGWLDKPLLAKNRFFVNLAYETRQGWSFDVTANWTGTKRMVEYYEPMGSHDLHHGYQTPAFWLFNAQVSKSWKNDQYRFYIGVENIANEMQHKLIINSGQPYSKGFDSGLIWGSAMGRNIYAGFNFKII